MMNQTLTLTPFRDCESGATEVHYSKKEGGWVCGDSAGSLYESKPGSNGAFTTFDRRMDDSSHEGKSLTALALSPDEERCALATGDEVHIYDFPSIADCISPSIVRRTLAVTHVAYDSFGSHIFVSSKEADILVYSTTTNKVDLKIRTQEMGVKTFTISPDSSYLAFVNEGASMQIVKLVSHSEGESSRVYSASEIVGRSSNIASTSSCRNADCNVSLAWHPDYPILVAPLQGGSLLVTAPANNSLLDLTKNLSGVPKGYHNFPPATQFSDTDVMLVGEESSIYAHSTDANLVAFSPGDGRYLVSADISGVVLLWDLDLQTHNFGFSPVLRKLDFGAPLLQLAWGSQDDDVSNSYLLVSAASGFQFVPNVVPVKTASTVVVANHKVDKPTAKAPQVAAGAVIEPTKAPSQFSKLQKTSARNGGDDDNYDDDDDDELFLDDLKASSAVDATTNVEPNDSFEHLKRDILENANKPRIQSDMRVSSAILKGNLNDEDEGDDEDDDMDIISNAAERDFLSAKKAKSLLNGVDPALAALLLSSAGQQQQLQKAFQPSETRFDEKLRRYMVWNHVGSITNYEEPSGSGNRVEVRFTNHESGKPEVFTDVVGYTRAALSQEGAWFASDAEEAPQNDPSDPDNDRAESGSGSELYYRAFPAGQRALSGANESFTYKLPPGEQATVVAAGKGWLAAACCHSKNNRHLLRVFSSTGLQLALWSLKGPVVTLVGCESHLAVFYHVGGPIATAAGSVTPAGGMGTSMQPRIAVDVLDIPHDQSAFSMIAEGVLLPLTAPAGNSAKSQLLWAGFDRESMLLSVLCSDDMLSTLVAVAGWQWVPVLDIASMKKTVDYTYWPVMVKKSQLVYVLLNGETRPSVFPPPVVSVAPFKVPVLMHKEIKDTFNKPVNQLAPQVVWDVCKANHLEHLKGTAGAVGNLALADDIALQLEQQEKDADKIVLKMLQEACKYQMNGVAFDLVHRLHTDQALGVAIKVANQFGRGKVAEAVDAILQQRQEMAFAMQQQQSEDAFENEAPSPAVETSFNRMQPPSAATTLSHKAVPPSYYHSTSEPLSDVYSAPVVAVPPPNPFAFKASPSSNSQVAKRKSVMEGFQEMKGSPSPKKPALVRTSSFTQQTRMTKNLNKSFMN